MAIAWTGVYVDDYLEYKALRDSSNFSNNFLKINFA